MRKIYAIEVLERNPITDNMEPAFVKPLPDIPLQDWKLETRKQLEDLINTLDLKWWHRDAIIAGIWYILNQHFPHHPYRITTIDWKY
jgi:hypothetical protein